MLKLSAKIRQFFDIRKKSATFVKKSGKNPLFRLLCFATFSACGV